VEDVNDMSAKLTCERCGQGAERELALAPDPFCHRCGDLMRIEALGSAASRERFAARRPRQALKRARARP
jgi:hypothetical protein